MNFLLTSVGRRTYMVKYFQRALDNIGEVHVANSCQTLATELSSHRVITPEIYDETYIETLLDYSKRNNISFVISLFDVDLMVLARNKDRFTSIGVEVILANQEKVEICNDKWKTHVFLQSIGLESPATFLQLDHVFDAIHSKRIRYPLIIKPRCGMGSIGIFYAHNDVELRALYSLSKKVCFSTYLRFESELTPDNPVLIQEVLEGEEYGLDVVNDLKGGFQACIAKQKVSMRAGETDVGLIVDPKRFESIVKLLSTGIAHQGVLSVDCFVTEKGIVITELNCRFSGHYPISHEAGADIPLFLVHQARGKQSSASLFQSKIGTYVAKDLVPTVFQG